MVEARKLLVPRPLSSVKTLAARFRAVKRLLLGYAGMKAIKLYAWEQPYIDRINQLREAELRMIRKAAFYQIFNTIMFGGGPILVSLASFGAFTFQGYSLTASVAFPALALFNLLRFPVMMFPNQIMNIIAAKVALDRIQNYMQVTNACTLWVLNTPIAAHSLLPSAEHAGSIGSVLITLARAGNVGKGQTAAFPCGSLHMNSVMPVAGGGAAAPLSDPCSCPWQPCCAHQPRQFCLGGGRGSLAEAPQPGGACWPPPHCYWRSGCRYGQHQVPTSASPDLTVGNTLYGTWYNSKTQLRTVCMYPFVARL